MDIPRKKLQALQILAQTTHFGRAAERLSISQPTLSRLVQDLEDRVDFQIFDRHTRAVSLTPMGQELLTYANQLEAFQLRATKRIDARKRGHRGHIIIASLPSLVGQIIAPLLAYLKHVLPDLSIEVMDQPSPEIRKSILMERADIGLDSPDDEKFDGLVAQKLVSDALCCVVGPNHPLAKRSRVHVRELKDYDLIGSAPGTSLRRLTDQTFAQHGRVFQPAHEFHQVVSVLGMVEYGIGAAILPIASGCALPAKCRTIVLDGAVTRMTWMFRKSHQQLDPSVAQVMSALNAVAGRRANKNHSPGSNHGPIA